MFNKLKNNKEIVWSLAVNDFSTKYAGSLFGVFWAFAQPVITILIYATVFQYGLRSVSPVPGVSYIYWFAAGMIPWFFVSDGIRAVTNVLIEYSYLVKKVLFDVGLLPVIKIISSLFIQLVFIVLLFLIGIFNKEVFSIHVIQTVYYLMCAIVLIYAIGRITSSLILFFRDLGQIVNIILDIALWATPIIWAINIVPAQYQWIVKLNPIFYIIEGYRDSFINEIWFYEKPVLSIYFWMVVCVLLFIGNKIFRKMQPQFADVI